MRCGRTDLDLCAEVLAGLGALKPLEVLVVRDADGVGQQLQLVEVILPREEGAPVHHLAEDAPSGPDVDLRGVVALHEEELRGTVPTSDDVVGQLRGHGGVVRAGETKVADTQIARDVAEEVRGLEVAMDDVG